jgi:hypothetical protein
VDECKPLFPGSDGSGPTHLVSGGEEGNVRFFDTKLRLVAWFDGLLAGGITSVSFCAPPLDGRDLHSSTSQLNLSR